MTQRNRNDELPLIPGSSYRVNDPDRPQPRIVGPGTESSQDAPGGAPSDAVILFDGSGLSNWSGADGEARWKVENGYMEVAAGTGSIRTREHFGDCQLHLEWAAPAEVRGESQGRGNSGVFLMGIYEIQVLDCHDNPTYADGAAAAIYGLCPPLVNACRKPGEWQTFDIVWLGPRFEGSAVARPARVTVFHNGVLVHHDRELSGQTANRRVVPYEPHPEVGPLELQDHNDPVRYRNIWYRPLTGYDEG